MDLIEARRLHADDESVKRLRADKDAADIKLKHAREELNAITAEYKRLVATKNAKDKVRVSGSVTAIRKRRVFVRRVVCRANVLSTDRPTGIAAYRHALAHIGKETKTIRDEIKKKYGLFLI